VEKNELLIASCREVSAYFFLIKKKYGTPSALDETFPVAVVIAASSISFAKIRE
jgi:hypothetical protein